MSKFKMISNGQCGVCVPISTPDNFFELEVKRERERAKIFKLVVKHQQIENQNRLDAANEIN
jgi:hypothetical protein